MENHLPITLWDVLSLLMFVCLSNEVSPIKLVQVNIQKNNAELLKKKKKPFTHYKICLNVLTPNLLHTYLHTNTCVCVCIYFNVFAYFLITVLKPQGSKTEICKMKYGVEK